MLLFPINTAKKCNGEKFNSFARKLPKVTNQHIMTCFSTLTICTSFSVILLLFPINMVKICSEQKYTTLNTKTYQKWKPTQDNYIFLPNYFAQNFWSLCCCFPSIRLQNITVKSLIPLAQKLPKVTNRYTL